MNHLLVFFRFNGNNFPINHAFLFLLSDFWIISKLMSFIYMYVLSFKANILFTDDTEQNSKSGNNYFFSVILKTAFKKYIMIYKISNYTFFSSSFNEF